MKLEKKALGFNYFESAFLFKPLVSNVNLHVLYTPGAIRSLNYTLIHDKGTFHVWWGGGAGSTPA